MIDPKEQLTRDAIAWTIRLREADAETWQAFTEWLEADPDRLDTYEETAALDAELGQLSRTPMPPVFVADPAPTARSFGPRRVVVGWGIAAVVAAAVGYWAIPGGSDLYSIETAPGERRSVSLADGSSIQLNGSSRIVLDRDDPRFSRLESGEALFTVVHDDTATFKVEVGSAVIRDLGTVFNVVKEGQLVKVEVAEGAVAFDAPARAVELREGGTLRWSGAAVATGRREPSEIGGWGKGQLAYSSAPIADVAADLSRSTGVEVRVSPEVAERRFTGVIVVGTDHQQLFRRISALLAVEATRSGEGWTLTAEDE